MDDEEGQIEGTVEHLDDTLGVNGWAIDLRDPARTLQIELWIGAEHVATTETGEERPDVLTLLNCDGRPGYRFAPYVGSLIRDAADQSRSGALQVRVAGHRRPLKSLVGTRSLELIRLTGSGMPPSHYALLDRLSHHATASAGRFNQPLRPVPARSIGFIEAVALDDLGFLWITGWIARDVLFDQPVIILDGVKHAAGFASVVAPRADLPPGSAAFVAIMLTSWRPTSASKPHIFLADGSGRYLDCLVPTPMRTKSEIASIVSLVIDAAEGGYPDFLRVIFRDAQDWSPTTPATSQDLLAVDEVAVLPGFGAFVSGWALSPTKELNALVLRVGDRILLASEQDVTLRPRPDLAQIYPGADASVGRAGFVTVMRGDFDSVHSHAMILKAVWSDGTSTNLAVGPERTRMLGLTAHLERVRTFYPAVTSEPFFVDFAHNAGLAAQARTARATPFTTEPMTAALILTVPRSRSDTFLMIEGVHRHATTLAAGHGVVILAGATQDRAVIVQLFTELRRAIKRPVAMFFVRDERAAVQALEEVATVLDLEWFAFVADTVLLEPCGWKSVATPPAGLTLLEVADPATGGKPYKTAGLDAFVAARRDWVAIHASLPPLLDGLNDAVVPTTVETRTAPNAAVTLRGATGDAFTAQVNEAINASYT